ncbi:MAG: aminotransferase class I/II-fold pyridoxal phosphate-dependent enzyme [Ruminococcus sp.]|nr:aminotransferase class I/II-fold pyridoxal phosphate-dependent enzyme [Ruminococcus sp.]
MNFHGGNIYTENGTIESENYIDFSSNINPFGVSNVIKNAIIESIQDLVHYPDPYCRELRRELSYYHKINKDYIVCGNGGADIIFRFIKAVSPTNALIPVPTFSEYESVLKECNCKINYFIMPEPFEITEKLLYEMQSGTYDFLVLCNPNNPTGSLIETQLLKKILDLSKKKQILVLLDECFYDITEYENSMIHEIDKYPNLFILKSMTKMYAIPGLRIGYGICSDKKLITKVQDTGQPWSVSTLASRAGCSALHDDNSRVNFLKFLKEERKYFYNELKNLGLKVWKPSANYIFFRAKGNFELDKQLLYYNIFIRHCENYKGLNAEYYRVAIRKHEENQYFIQCLKKIINE